MGFKHARDLINIRADSAQCASLRRVHTQLSSLGSHMQMDDIYTSLALNTHSAPLENTVYSFTPSAFHQLDSTKNMFLINLSMPIGTANQCACCTSLYGGGMAASEVIISTCRQFSLVLSRFHVHANFLIMDSSPRKTCAHTHNNNCQCRKVSFLCWWPAN